MPAPSSLVEPAAKSMGTTRCTKPALDKSWGMAALACGATFLSSAAHSTSGFFYVEFMREYGINRETASWPSSTFLAMDQAAGMIVLVLLRFIPVSRICKIGGVLLSSGIIASVFAPDMVWTSLTFGFVQGLGAGFLSVAVTVILMMYFDRYRAVATGIRYAGFSLSALIYPPILSIVNDVFTFRQMVLIYGGISLHIAPLLISFKEPPWTRSSSGVKILPTKERAKTCVIAVSIIEDVEGVSKNSAGRQPGSVACAHKRSIESCTAVNGDIVLDYEKKLAMQIVSELRKMSSCKTDTDRGDATLYRKDGCVRNSLCEMHSGNVIFKGNCRDAIQREYVNDKNLKTSAVRLSSVGRKCKRDNVTVFPEHAPEVLPHSTEYKKLVTPNSVHSLPAAQEQTCGSNELYRAPHLTKKFINCDKDKVAADVRTSGNSLEKAKTEHKWTTSYVQLLLTPSFWAVVLGAVLADFNDCCVMATLVDSALDRGATRFQADLTIALTAPSQLVGRTLLPLVADVGFVTRTSLSCVCFFLFACLVAVLSVTHNFATYTSCAAAASLLMGCLATMKYVVAADHFGVEAVPAAWAGTGTFLLPMLLCSPSMLGFFRDKQGSYDNFYYFLGSLNILMGIIFLLLSCSAIRRTKTWTVDHGKPRTSGIMS